MTCRSQIAWLQCQTTRVKDHELNNLKNLYGSPSSSLSTCLRTASSRYTTAQIEAATSRNLEVDNITSPLLVKQSVRYTLPCTWAKVLGVRQSLSIAACRESRSSDMPLNHS